MNILAEIYVLKPKGKHSNYSMESNDCTWLLPRCFSLPPLEQYTFNVVTFPTTDLPRFDLKRLGSSRGCSIKCKMGELWRQGICYTKTILSPIWIRGIKP